MSRDLRLVVRNDDNLVIQDWWWSAYGKRHHLEGRKRMHPRNKRMWNYSLCGVALNDVTDAPTNVPGVLPCATCLRMFGASAP